MKKSVGTFKSFVLASLLFLSVHNLSAQAQFQNGNFQAGPLQCNMAIPNWTTGVGIFEPQHTNANTGGNRWVDITPCGSFGNDAWIEQAVQTTPGQTYQISLDIGTWLGWQQWDAGVDITVNGAPLNVGPNRLFNSVFGANPSFQNFTSNTFVAQTCPTVIRFTGHGDNPLNPGYVQSSPGPGIMGIDNIQLITLPGTNNFFNITVNPAEGCNEFCLSVAYIGEYEPPLILNVDWYVNDIPEASSGLNNFCRRFPKNVLTPVKAVVNLYPCGTVTVETYILASQDCPCDISNHADLTATPVGCCSYNIGLGFDPGYSSIFTYWTVDDQHAPTLPNNNLDFLYSGTHTVCALMMGGVTGEDGNLCCAKVCTVIEVSVGGKAAPPATGLNQVNLNEPLVLQIVPNPTSSTFRLKSTREVERYEKIDITDGNGRIVFSQNNVSPGDVINPGRLAKGIYYVKVRYHAQNNMLKLVILDE